MVLVVDAVRSRLRSEARLLVAVDGPDAAGKTTFADAMAMRLGTAVVRASVDGFHNRREVRTRRGALSAEGYYRDSFDLAALADNLLIPFAAGAASVTTRVYDVQRDRAVERATVRIPDVAVLVFDGVFLLRPELRHYWGLAVYLDVPPATTLERALVRDVAVFGCERDVRTRYETRYLPGQELYRREAEPLERADVIIDNTDLAAPRLVRLHSAS